MVLYSRQGIEEGEGDEDCERSHGELGCDEGVVNVGDKYREMRERLDQILERVGRLEGLVLELSGALSRKRGRSVEQEVVDGGSGGLRRGLKKRRVVLDDSDGE